MTARQIWLGMLTELSKANAPSLLLHEFNYYFNKAINLYINKRYNIYDINLLTTDDLRVLKATARLEPTKKVTEYNPKGYSAGKARLFDATYEVNLPSDYLHMLNCICVYELAQDADGCYNTGDYVSAPATRLTADAWSVIVRDYYRRPTPWNPYYYIHNVNTSSTVPTNPVSNDFSSGTDLRQKYEVEPKTTEIPEYITKTTWKKDNVYYIVSGDIIYEAKGNEGNDRFEIKTNDDNSLVIAEDVKISELTKIIEEQPNTELPERKENSNFARKITLGSPDFRTVSTVLKDAGTRYGNASTVRCEIRYGNDSNVYLLREVLIDYIKTPQYIRLTKEQVDLTEDTSQIMEFPDYVCHEIINELTTLVMARDSDPRLQTQPLVTQSIANPAQALTPQQSRLR